MNERREVVFNSLEREGDKLVIMQETDGKKWGVYHYGAIASNGSPMIPRMKLEAIEGQNDTGAIYDSLEEAQRAYPDAELKDRYDF